MNRPDWNETLGGLDDALLHKAVSTYRQGGEARGEDGSGTEPGAKTPRRLARILLIAAAVAALLTGGVLAAGRLINSPEQAWRVAQEEIGRWKELGLLSPEVELPESASLILEQPEKAGSGYWFGRIWPRRYSVSAFRDGDQYSFHLNVDTATGRITNLTIEAAADGDDTPEPGRDIELNGTIYHYYRNFDDIFPAGLTVDRCCALLAEYWGFGGYTLSGTRDSFYGYDTDAPAGGMPLAELGTQTYLTVYFTGDQSGAPMYVELHQFPGRVGLMVGTNHGVG